MNSTARDNRHSLTTKPSTLGRFLQKNQLLFVATVILLSLLLFIIVLFLIVKYSRKKPRQIQRKGVIIKRNLQPTADDADSTLLGENPEQPIDNVLDIDENPVLDQSTNTVTSDTPRYSTVSMTEEAVKEINNKDDSSYPDLTKIQLRVFNSTNAPSQHSSFCPSENIYVKEYREQAAVTRKPCPSLTISSTSSEESCL